jgi:hypothetical protein
LSKIILSVALGFQSKSAKFHILGRLSSIDSRLAAWVFAFIPRKVLPNRDWVTCTNSTLFLCETPAVESKWQLLLLAHFYKEWLCKNEKTWFKEKSCLWISFVKNADMNMTHGRLSIVVAVAAENMRSYKTHIVT